MTGTSTMEGDLDWDLLIMSMGSKISTDFDDFELPDWPEFDDFELSDS